METNEEEVETEVRKEIRKAKPTSHLHYSC